MVHADKKTETGKSKPSNPLRLASFVFLLFSLWFLGTALYSRWLIAPTLGTTAADPARRDDARRLMKRAAWLAFGDAVFEEKLHDGHTPECVSGKSLADMESDFTRLLADERKTAERLVMIPDPVAAERYGPRCAQFVNDLKVQRSEGRGPSDADALATIMVSVEFYVTARIAQQYGERAAALLLELRSLQRNNTLTQEKRDDLDRRWRQIAEREIADFQQLVMINGRNGYVFGGYLLLASIGFLLISRFARSFIPQEPVEKSA
ncbi:MAG: hypothetical protein AB1696_05915 [Planctomycetota bacterium]